MVLRSAPLPVNSACRSHCPAWALQAPPPQTRRLEQHSEQSTGRLCLSPLTRAGLTARVPHWGTTPAAPATAPHHEELASGLPGPCCGESCRLPWALPGVPLCPGCGPPAHGLPAQPSPRAASVPCWPSCDREVESLLLYVLRQETRTCQSCVCHAIGVIHQRSSPWLFCPSTRSRYMYWNNQCHPLLVLGEQPKPCTRIGALRCQTGN